MKLHDFISPIPDSRRKTVVVPLANNPDSIRCIAASLEKKIAKFILLGEECKIRNVALQEGVDISSAEFIQETDEQAACDKAAQIVGDGRAQVLMKGLVQSATFIRAILHKEHGLIPPGKLISCVSVFEIPTYHKLLFITDPGVNIAPSLAGKVLILQNAIELATKMGVQHPKIACVEAVEKVSAKMPSTAEAQQLKAMGQRGVFGTALVDGPLGFDVAISKKAAVIKQVESPVAGDPDILLLPEIVAANVLYKCLVWFAHATVASVVIGAKVPIILPSRSDSEESKLLSVALAVHMASQG
ncbi:MAG: phosphate butyryltransferase [Verrucomicrobia bacterium]|nr:phosphate butyryltransferase [Verrucomicrobiota bacterium]MBU4247027.1 phosphate butyryltransferase [Verrucomicrobiota bacterium]MBU4290323.1 phosphate butyryltransferase [Verrucomicrobiota bacterium]MBU4429116.1 phosphate butyryltransferase [Verrucomicrobiota bacterium]MCG2681777.1 phosphate butyryltransferase [Kiritimatiellia bacterium]